MNDLWGHSFAKFRFIHKVRHRATIDRRGHLFYDEHEKNLILLF